ncbi:MAG: diacylglycerol kinase [Oceanospirillaceae bacterium]|nr:diacylglycerol kinase [Oceanospirillaceae bacterium]
MNQQIPPPETGIKRIFKAAGYSWQGIVYAWQNEAAFRQEFVLFVVASIVAIFSSVSPVEKAVLIGSVAIVIIVEILNSAIEAVVDRFGKEFHPLSKAAKDMGSAAVFISLAAAALIWMIIFIPLL